MARENSDRYPPPRSQHPRLLEKYGAYCQGCGCDFTDNPNDLEVDHIRPKSDGGTDAYENLTLLCPPCNRSKSDTMTLTGLQQRNRREGILRPENEFRLKIGRGANNKWRAAFAAVEELLAQEAPDEWAAYKTAKTQADQDYEAFSGQKLSDLYDVMGWRSDFYDVKGWRNKRRADERLKRKKAELKKAAAPDKYPDEWAAYEEYESKKAALETAAVKAEAQLARAYPDEWAAYKAFESRKARDSNKLAFALTFALDKWEEYTVAEGKYEAVKAEVKANLKAAMEAAAPEEWAAAAEEWKAYEAAYKEYEGTYESGVHPDGWALAMAGEDDRTKKYRWALVGKEYASEEYNAAEEEYKKAHKAAYEAAYEEYKAMTPDEWMAKKIRYLRYKHAHPANEWMEAMASAAPDEWKAYKEAKEAVDIQMVWAADISYAYKAYKAALNALALAAPEAADAYFALRAAYRDAQARK